MATEEIEDAVTFLENAKKSFPNVTSLLTTPQLLSLDMDPQEPFNELTVDQDFVKLSESYFTVKFSIDQAKSALRGALMEPVTKGKEVDVEAEKAVISCLEMVCPRLINAHTYSTRLHFTYIHIHTRHMPTHLPAPTHAYVHTHTHTRTHTHMPTPAHPPTCPHTHTHARMHTRSHTHTHTHTHKRTG